LLSNLSKGSRVLLKNIIRTTIILILISIALGNFVQTGYYLIRPGSAESLGDRVRVEGKARAEEGQFFMVTVAQQKANLWHFLYALFNPVLDLRPISHVIPPGMSFEEYNRIMQSWMQDSKYLAQVIALQKAGYEVVIASDGVEVKDIIPGSPAAGILKAGDIIKAVEGEDVYLAEEVVNMIQAKEIGQSVTLMIQRGEALMDVVVNTTSHMEQPEKAALRIYVSTLNWQPILPVAIDIETGPVVGPSAGVMFVLEILDRLVPENLTGGKTIAGTGTINLEGNIGGIGGVKQKVVTAEQMGIEYFLTPEENYAEASRAARQIEIISVRNLDEVLAFLQDS
jgi:PDZ domain-containing protein